MSRILGLPDPVLAYAYAAGVHNDCVVAGPDSCCPGCLTVVTTALYALYGDPAGRSREVVAAIFADLLAEAPPVSSA